MDEYSDQQQPGPESLLRYGEPVPVSQPLERSSRKKSKAERRQDQMQNILDTILPPRTIFDQDGNEYKQKVSPIPATRPDVKSLEVALDTALQLRQARPPRKVNGICPVRKQLYTECLDELIRQVTLNSPERGLLLLRIRDEVRMTVDAYQTLYKNSVTYGTNKATLAEEGKSELQQRIEALDAENKSLKAVLNDAKLLAESVDKQIAEQQTTDDKIMADELEFLENNMSALLDAKQAAQDGFKPQ